MINAMANLLLAEAKAQYNLLGGSGSMRVVRGMKRRLNEKQRGQWTVQSTPLSIHVLCRCENFINYKYCRHYHHYCSLVLILILRHQASQFRNYLRGSSCPLYEERPW